MSKRCSRCCNCNNCNYPCLNNSCYNCGFNSCGFGNNNYCNGFDFGNNPLIWLLLLNGYCRF